MRRDWAGAGPGGPAQGLPVGRLRLPVNRALSAVAGTLAVAGSEDLAGAHPRVSSRRGGRCTDDHASWEAGTYVVLGTIVQCITQYRARAHCAPQAASLLSIGAHGQRKLIRVSAIARASMLFFVEAENERDSTDHDD